MRKKLRAARMHKVGWRDSGTRLFWSARGALVRFRKPLYTLDDFGLGLYLHIQCHVNEGLPENDQI